jgi:hypothetical protein
MLRLSVNGKKHRESTHTNDLRKAMAFRDRRKAELLVGMSHVDDRKFLIGSLADDYLAAMRRDGLETVAKSEERWRLHLAPVFESQPANLLTTDQINSYITCRQTEGGANATINRELAVVKRTYIHAGSAV